MDRRLFLRRAALITAGVVAADQIDLLERLTWTRSMFPSAAVNDVETLIVAPHAFTQTELDALLKRIYTEARQYLSFSTTPLTDILGRRREPRSLFAPTAPHFDVVVDRRCPPNTAFVL